MKDYYAILGLPCTASAAEIDAAFRSLAKKHHPDLHPQDRQSLELFKLVAEAHEVLSNAAKRRHYDRAQQQRRASRPKPFFSTGLCEPTSRQMPSAELLDLEARLPLTPEEARWGTTIEFKLTYPITCPQCGGNVQLDCPICGSKGTQLQSEYLTLQLPPGLANGELLRVPGRGRYSAATGTRGDLRVIVQVRPRW